MAVITVAREFGAGGKTLANHVAKQLNYTVIDEEIVEQVALEANVHPEWVDNVASEAGGGGWLPRLVSKLGPFRKGYVDVSMESNPGYIDGNLYIHLLHKVLPKIAEQDNLLIVGRGGQYILADWPNAIHILMIADLERRITFMMENYNLTRKQAQIVVDKQGKRRLNLYRYFGKTDYDQPSLYHMVFNMSLVSMESAVSSVCQLVNAASSS